MSRSELFLIPDWPAPDNVHAATTLRSGGFSKGNYANLNTALHVGDIQDNVIQNRELIQQTLNLPSPPAWLNQVHSNKIVEAIPGMMPPPADASYSLEPGVVCVVMTADCLPLLFCNAEGSKIAAVHAGWRGLLDGVISNTVKALGPDDYMVWLGPAIGPEKFEVGQEVMEAFSVKAQDNAQAFKPLGQSKWLADIYKLARLELTGLGIDKVYGGQFCTVTDNQRFYSYRRDTVTGRMATLIWRD